MASLGGIDIARNNLRTVSNNYAEIQRQLDRYNKVFETYANASPETQMRAASVMRQALDEYNGLKKQQEENSLKMYEAQQWVDYYNNALPQSKPIEIYSEQNNIVKNVPLNEVRPLPTETISVISVATPGTMNNNVPATNMELNALDTNTTMNVPINPIFANLANQNKVNPTTPVGVTNYIFSNMPRNTGETIGPVTTPSSTTNNINRGVYGPGNVAQTPGSGGTVGINTTNSLFSNKAKAISNIRSRRRNSNLLK